MLLLLRVLEAAVVQGRGRAGAGTQRVRQFAGLGSTVTPKGS